MTEIGSPVAGNVWQILVAVGDVVEAGQELIVLESMKMEIPVEAPHNGTVVALATEDGASVEAGDLLITLE
ncbi:MAG: acetyl-CoA carboxylase biotin carboxyl carrier protein subunit [Acidobacteria bacterium]|nr:acetyl-CoA carboxylase biotin carboxyl carrier protein subunit [Acidobacteriota bacterium]